MKRLFVMLVVGLSTSATWIAAHGGVSNPAVLARMESMKQQQDAVKILGSMVKGAVAFDAQKARAAIGQLAEHAAQTTVLFEAQEMDPKTEALPNIWTSFDDFETKAAALEAVALELQGAISDPGDLANGLTQIGSACKSCHQQYRK